MVAPRRIAFFDLPLTVTVERHIRFQNSVMQNPDLENGEGMDNLPAMRSGLASGKSYAE